MTKLKDLFKNKEKEIEKLKIELQKEKEKQQQKIDEAQRAVDDIVASNTSYAQNCKEFGRNLPASVRYELYLARVDYYKKNTPLQGREPTKKELQGYYRVQEIIELLDTTGSKAVTSPPYSADDLQAAKNKVEKEKKKLEN